MITFSWQITPDQVWPEISQRQVDAIEHNLVKLCDGMTEEIAAWMKANAPWQDRTGDARAALHAELVHVAREFAGVMMSHGEEIAYAYWLEIIQQGKFGVIAPALDYFAPRLKKEAAAIVRRYSS